MGSSKVVGREGPAYTQKNMDRWVAIKKLLVSAIFNPEYSEFFIDRFYTNLNTAIIKNQDFVTKNPNDILVEFAFNDQNKEIGLCINAPNYTDYLCHALIREAFGMTIVDILSTGRMCDILYLINAEYYNIMSHSVIYGVNDAMDYNGDNLFYPRHIAEMFNINTFGNGRYILSLIQ